MAVERTAAEGYHQQDNPPVGSPEEDNQPADIPAEDIPAEDNPPEGRILLGTRRRDILISC